MENATTPLHAAQIRRDTTPPPEAADVHKFFELIINRVRADYVDMRKEHAVSADLLPEAQVVGSIEALRTACLTASAHGVPFYVFAFATGFVNKVFRLQLAMPDEKEAG